MMAEGPEGYIDSRDSTAAEEGRARQLSMEGVQTNSSTAPDRHFNWARRRTRQKTEPDENHISPRQSRISDPQKPEVAHIDQPQRQRRATEWFDVIDDISETSDEK